MTFLCGKSRGGKLLLKRRTRRDRMQAKIKEVALKRLDNAEIDALLAGVTTEAKRRGRLPPSPAKEPQTRQGSAEDGAGSLTSGKLNAVRAAFKAGVKPSAIARQFGISQSDIRKALATEGRPRKSGR